MLKEILPFTLELEKSPHNMNEKANLVMLHLLWQMFSSPPLHISSTWTLLTLSRGCTYSHDQLQERAHLRMLALKVNSSTVTWHSTSIKLWARIRKPNIGWCTSMVGSTHPSIKYTRCFKDLNLMVSIEAY